MSDFFFAAFYITYMLVVLSTVVFVVLDNRDPVKAMAWILVLFFLPAIGLVLYFFLGRSNRKEKLISKKGYSRLIKRPKAAYQMQESLNVGEDKSRIMSFFKNVNNALPFDGNKVCVFTEGSSMFLSLLRDIYNAKHHIHVEFYILKDDAVGRMLRDALIYKSREGVKIRVLYDDVGCWKVDNDFYDLMMCEGNNEKAIMNLLLDANKLKITRDDLIELTPFHVRQLSNPTIISMLKNYNKEVTILRIGDTQKDKLIIPKELKDIVSPNRIYKYCTLPEIEILLIINEGLYNEFLKSKDKPKGFAIKNIRYNKVKYNQSSEFFVNYYGGKRISNLVDNLKKYKHIKKHNKDELYLADLLK